MKKYRVYQEYVQTDFQIVEADSEEEAIEKCYDGDGWKDFKTNDYSIFADEVKDNG